MKLKSRVLLLSALASAVQAASAADLTGTITLTGTPPPEKVNDHIAANADCGKMHSEPVKTQFYVVGANKGLADVVVTIKGAAKSTGEALPPLVIDQKGCEYIPYIAAAQVGQKIVIKNSDPVMHNVHTTPMVDGNKEKNTAQMPGSGDLTFSFVAPEPFLRFKCDVHDWMLSYVTVVDNPYFAVSAKDGTYKIKGLPPGKYTVQFAHRKATNGVKSMVTKEIEVKDGDNKLDVTLEVPPAA